MKLLNLKTFLQVSPQKNLIQEEQMLNSAENAHLNKDLPFSLL